MYYAFSFLYYTQGSLYRLSAQAYLHEETTETSEFHDVMEY